MSNPDIEFRHALDAAGLAPVEIIMDGQLHRCPTADKPNGKDGAYIAHADEPASIWWQNWRIGQSDTWTAKSPRELSPAEREDLKRRIELDRTARVKATAELHTEKAALAAFIYESAQNCPEDHAYLVKKGVPALGGLGLSRDGRVIIPVRNERGEIQSLQFIGEDGQKRFLSGAKMAGGYFAIKNYGDKTGPLYVCEGYATGATVHLATGATVLCAFNAGNLMAVAEMARRNYPERVIILCADDDLTEGNPGLAKATEAARSINGKLAVPTFQDHAGRSDFNDMAQEQGLDAVRDALAAVKAPEKAAASKDSSGTSAHLEMARSCIATFGAGNIVFTLGDFWRWGGSGVWRKTEAQAVKQAAHRLYPEKIKSAHTVNSILELAKTEAFMEGRDFTPTKGRTINCQSGVLHWTGHKWELRAHRREDYATAQLPVAYDPDATAPRFEQFLEEVFASDEDAEDKMALVCEAMGYSCVPLTEFEKFFLLIGAGANGKSVLLNIVEDIVGRENACAVQPSQFDNRFQRAHLHGKLVNIVSEIAEGAEIADAQLKAIVSGELTTAEHKLRSPFDFRPYATCWFGTNHMPHTRDFSQALFRRAMVIPFNRVFAEHEQDKILGQKLKGELPGIFNLALEALAGVFERGMFTVPKSSERARQEWRVQADQVAQFAEDCCRFGPGLKCTSKETFARYTEWAGEVGIVRKLNRKNFTDRMTRLGAAPHKGTGGERLLFGVGVVA